MLTNALPFIFPHLDPLSIKQASKVSKDWGQAVYAFKWGACWTEKAPFRSSQLLAKTIRAASLQFNYVSSFFRTVEQFLTSSNILFFKHSHIIFNDYKISAYDVAAKKILFELPVERNSVLLDANHGKLLFQKKMGDLSLFEKGTLIKLKAPDRGICLKAGFMREKIAALFVRFRKEEAYQPCSKIMYKVCLYDLSNKGERTTLFKNKIYPGNSSYEMNLNGPNYSSLQPQLAWSDTLIAALNLAPGEVWVKSERTFSYTAKDAKILHVFGNRIVTESHMGTTIRDENGSLCETFSDSQFWQSISQDNKLIQFLGPPPDLFGGFYQMSVLSPETGIRKSYPINIMLSSDRSIEDSVTVAPHANALLFLDTRDDGNDKPELYGAIGKKIFQSNDLKGIKKIGQVGSSLVILKENGQLGLLPIWKTE